MDVTLAPPVRSEIPHLAPAITALPGENPALSCVPTYASARDACKALEHVPDGTQTDLAADARILIPTTVHSRLLLELSRSAQASAHERDLSTEAFRAKVITAHQFLNQKRDPYGDSTPPVTVSLPGVQAKVHFAVVANGLGQRALIQACERIFGDKSRPVDVPVPSGGGWIRFFRMDTLVHNFPPNGSPRTFYRTLAQKIDGVFRSGHAHGRHGSPRGSNEEAGTAAQALLLSVNVGLLIIGPISTRDSNPSRAGAMWSMLATLAAETGIPILIVATPGAAANLIEHSGAQFDLSGRGVYEVEAFGLESKAWNNVVLAVWVQYLRAFAKAPPAWFYAELWAQTLGRIELAVKLAAHIAGYWEASGSISLTQAQFREHARNALVLESPRIRAIHRARFGGEFTRGQVMANADWLPLQMVVKSLPALDEKDDLFLQTTHGSVKSSIAESNALRSLSEELRNENSGESSITKEVVA